VQPGSSTPEPAVAWSEELCCALLPVAQSAGIPPSLDASDLEGSRQHFHIYLRNQVDALNTALTQIVAARPAPVDKGAQVDQVLVTTLSPRRGELAAGLAELAGEDVDHLSESGHDQGAGEHPQHELLRFGV
jgi:hypothetical protein